MQTLIVFFSDVFQKTIGFTAKMMRSGRLKSNDGLLGANRAKPLLTRIAMNAWMPILPAPTYSSRYGNSAINTS